MRNWLLRRQLRKMNKELRKILKVPYQTDKEDSNYGGDD
jgi:hypothetical protein